MEAYLALFSAEHFTVPAWRHWWPAFLGPLRNHHVVNQQDHGCSFDGRLDNLQLYET